ncbi:MAG TPA: tetratricopeptide repeat protein [Caulobacteraceae bacterium]|jgi:tetratricopeptide (TPR) repeat protein
MAADLIGRAITLNNRIALFHQSLANTLRIQGKLDECVSSCERAIALKPDYFHAHYNLAFALSGLGRLGDAVARFRRATALEPDFADAHHNLALALKDAGEVGDAAASFRRAIALKPDLAEAHCYLGAILMKQDELDQAATCFRRAIELRPDLADAHYNLALASAALGTPDQAVESYRRAIALKPDFADAHYNLGNILVRLGRVEEGEACLRRASELETGRAEIWFNLGVALAILGELDAARAAQLHAAELDPHAEEAIYALAGLQPMNDGSAEAEAAFAVVSRLADDLDQLAPDKRPPAMFAMAKALEDRGEFDRAFAFMAQANAVVRASLTVDIAAVERRFNTIAKAFDGPLLERLKDAGSADERPIFIFGMPRSGTTLIEQILSAHPAVKGAGELLNLSDAITAQSTPGRTTYEALAKTLNGADCRFIAQTYLDSLPPALRGQVRITDKGMANFEHLGLIHLCLPNARIIHCRRDPRDVCLSCYSRRFNNGQGYAYNLVELGRYWRARDRLMSHWRAVLPPGRVLEVSYEAVVEDPEAWSRRLIAHCGLEWDDACLRFHESRRPVNTASLAQVRRPIYASSVGRWRRFARHLGPLLQALGEPWADEGYAIVG